MSQIGEKCCEPFSDGLILLCSCRPLVWLTCIGWAHLVQASKAYQYSTPHAVAALGNGVSKQTLLHDATNSRSPLHTFSYLEMKARKGRFKAKVGTTTSPFVFISVCHCSWQNTLPLSAYSGNPKIPIRLQLMPKCPNVKDSVVAEAEREQFLWEVSSIEKSEGRKYAKCSYMFGNPSFTLPTLTRQTSISP